MRNALLVAIREYVENARTKGFWIGIFMLPVILALSIQVPIFLERKGAPVRHFVLQDFSGDFERAIEAEIERQHQQTVLRQLNEYARKFARAQPGVTASELPWVRFSDLSPAGVDRFTGAGGTQLYLEELKGYLPPDAPRFEEPRKLYRRLEIPGLKLENLSAASEQLRGYLRGEEMVLADGKEVLLNAAILVPAEVRLLRPGEAEGEGGRGGGGAGGVQYWSGNLTEKSLRNLVERAINEVVRAREYAARGLDPSVFQEIERTRVPLVELNPKKQEGEERVGRAEILAQWAPVAFVYLLWIALFSISQMLLSNTIEEKSNRIIEVLLSSVTPAEYMMGKLAGIAAVGLTMVGAWIGSFLLLVTWKASGQSELAAQLVPMIRGSNLLPAFFIYFTLGYMLYAGIILALGSVCNTLKEAQNYMAVVTVLMMVPLLTMAFIPKDPNGTLATVLSWIPIYTPFVMMNRAAADPPMFDVIGTIVMLLAANVLVLWGAVKIFRIGILRTGQRPPFREILRWLAAR